VSRSRRPATGCGRAPLELLDHVRVPRPLRLGFPVRHSCRCWPPECASSVRYIDTVCLHFGQVFGIGRFLRLSISNMRMRIPYDDLPNTSRLIALCQVLPAVVWIVLWRLLLSRASAIFARAKPMVLPTFAYGMSLCVWRRSQPLRMGALHGSLHFALSDLPSSLACTRSGHLHRAGRG